MYTNKKIKYRCNQKEAKSKVDFKKLFRLRFEIIDKGIILIQTQWPEATL